MIFEALPTQFNVARLRQHLEENVLPLSPVIQSASFGGWSVLSSDGSYKDGWHKGHLVTSKDIPLDEYNKSLKQIGAKPIHEYIQPTEICTGYLKEVIEHLRDLGLVPRRTRITKLTAGFASSWHRDTPEHTDFVRLHIPIITNPDCFFEIESEREHMPADGSSYLVRVNRLHRVINGGKDDRFHLITDVTDTKGASQFHRAK